MKFSFSVRQEQDTTVAVAVGSFLDGEHYQFLHKGIMSGFRVLGHEGRKIHMLQHICWLGLRMDQTFTIEYLPPGHFRTYNLKPSPWWIPSIHHIVKNTVVDVRYYPHPAKDLTIMQFDVAMDIPFWFYPFRHLLRMLLEKCHHAKEQEDLEMIYRRAKIYGRENISYFLAEHQFLLHKDEYVEHFGNRPT